MKKNCQWPSEKQMKNKNNEKREKTQKGTKPTYPLYHSAGVTNGICAVLQGIHHGTVSFKGMFFR